jgi:hypothetical protein
MRLPYFVTAYARFDTLERLILGLTWAGMGVAAWRAFLSAVGFRPVGAAPAEGR